MFSFELLILITFSAAKLPNKYAPLSPKNILALGKLNNKNINKIIICAKIMIENSWLPLLILENNKKIFIIIK